MSNNVSNIFISVYRDLVTLSERFSSITHKRFYVYNFISRNKFILLLVLLAILGYYKRHSVKRLFLSNSRTMIKRLGY